MEATTAEPDMLVPEQLLAVYRANRPVPLRLLPRQRTAFLADKPTPLPRLSPEQLRASGADRPIPALLSPRHLMAVWAESPTPPSA